MSFGTKISAESDSTIRDIFAYATRIGSEPQFEELVRLNADFARDLVGADRCSLWLLDSTTNELWTKVAHEVESLRIPFGMGIVGACIRENRVILINEAEDEPRFLRSVDQNSGYRTKQILCVPLRGEGKVIGALQLLNKPGGFTGADAELLGLIAHFAASAVETERLRRESESARLIRHELAIARDVQARLLPEPPIGIQGLECSGFCRPARTIGGDYYDLMQLHDCGFALTVGDVSGKGIPAAVMMASIQMLLRGRLQQPGSVNLAAIFADLNRTLYVSSTAERYSTLFCGIVSADRSTLSYVNAGHVSPLLLHGDGRLEKISGSGVPVGLLPDLSYEQFNVRLAAGDTLVVVSDGIIEVCNQAGEFWDETEVERMLLDHLAIPLAKVPVLLCDAADRFAAGAEQYDDMTVVALRLG